MCWILTETMYSYVLVWKSFAFFFFTMMSLPIQENCVFPFIWVFFFFYISVIFNFFHMWTFFIMVILIMVFFFFLISRPFSLWLWPFSLWLSLGLSPYGYCLFDSSVKFFFFFSFLDLCYYGNLQLFYFYFFNFFFAAVLYLIHCKGVPVDVLLYFK